MIDFLSMRASLHYPISSTCFANNVTMNTSNNASVQPQGDYPHSFSQFSDRFGDELACLHYLEQLRWPTGFVCPACGKAGESYRSSRNRLVCPSCRHQCTATAGTIFDKTRTPLRTWFAAMWYLTSLKFGVTALELQQALGIGSYQTSWAMLHRLRLAMAHSAREPLHGSVEVGEAYVGVQVEQQLSLRPGRKQKKRPTPRTLVIMAVEIDIRSSTGLGRIRLRRIPHAEEQYVVPFVCETVETGARIDTDGTRTCLTLSKHDYEHRRHGHLGDDSPAQVSMPGVHRVALMLQQWLQGAHRAHQAAMRGEQIDYYLNEFTFRFNHRASGSRGLLFYRLLQQAVATEPVTYRGIVNRNT